MGGNALKNIDVKRLDISMYQQYSDEVLSLLRSIWPERQMSLTIPYADKNSFGDIDQK